MTSKATKLAQKIMKDKPSRSMTREEWDEATKDDGGVSDALDDNCDLEKLTDELEEAFDDHFRRKGYSDDEIKKMSEAAEKRINEERKSRE